MDTPNLLQPDFMIMAVTLVVWAIFWIGVPVALFLFARRLLRLLERRSIREEQFAELAERLRSLEERLEDVADDNERLLEDQRFLRQLLQTRVQDRVNE